MSWFKLTLGELQDRFTQGDVSAEQIVRAFFLRISVVESKVKAFITLNDKEALLAEAEALDRDLKGWP